MKKSLIFSNVLIWIIVLLTCVCSGLFEGMDTFTADVEYDHNMNTECFRTEVILSEENSYLITETIDVDMLTPRHGIYRYIPQKGYSEAYTADGNTEKVPYYADVEVLGCNVPVETETSDGFFVMRLGSEYQTVYGEQQYKIQYRFTPRFQREDFNFAYYNLFPLCWQNEIPKGSSFRFTFPGDFDKSRLRLYSGKYGSTASPADILDLTWNGSTLEGVLKEDMEFLSGITLFAEMEDGYFTRIHTIPGVGNAVAAAALIILVLMAVLFVLFGRDPQIIPSVQFQPPEGLDSAGVGYIIDGSVETKDVLSLILYWADQGYLTIEETKKGEIYLCRTNKTLPQDVPKYQTLLYNRLLKADRQSLESLKYKCEDTIVACKNLIRDYYRGKGGIYSGASKAARVFCSVLTIVPMVLFVGLLAEFSRLSTLRMVFYAADVILLIVGVFIFNSVVDNWYSRSDKHRIAMAVLGTGLAMLSVATLAGSYVMQLLQGEVFQFLPALIAVAAASGAGVVLSGFMKKRTDQCAEWMGRLAGLREFIQTAELDRLKVLAEENPEWFYHILPYTYVFGLSDIFAKKLEGLAIPAPEWYTGYDRVGHGWDYYYFNRCMMGSMRRMTDTLTLSEPPKTSGSSTGGGGFSGGGSFGGGGGFTGGGFGGGGGGSW